MFSLLKLENYATSTTLPSSANIPNETKLNGGKHTLDYENKQDIYIVLLQLLRLILFGSIYELDPVVVPCPIITGGQVAGGSNCKRPSSEPIITTCSKKTITPSMILNQLNEQKNIGTSTIIANASQETTTTTTTTNAQTSNAFNNNSTCLEAKTTNLIQKMTLSEVVDLVMQLLTIFWSAAAGNIQLAYSSLSASSSLNSLSTALGNYTNENNCNFNFNSTLHLPFKEDFLLTKSEHIHLYVVLRIHKFPL